MTIGKALNMIDTIRSRAMSLDNDTYIEVSEALEYIYETICSLNAQVKAKQHPSGWISVEERLPDDVFGCLVIVED